jgi:hypothetical protein
MRVRWKAVELEWILEIIFRFFSYLWNEAILDGRNEIFMKKTGISVSPSTERHIVLSAQKCSWHGYYDKIFLLSLYYKGKYLFHSKKFEFFLLKTCFLPIKSHKTWKKAINFFPPVTRRREQIFFTRLQPRP